MGTLLPDADSQGTWQNLQHLKAQYLERFTKIKWAIVSQLLEVTNQGKPELEVTRKTLSTMRGTAEGVLTILEVPDLKTAELLRRSHFPLGLAHLQQSMDQFLNAEGARLDTLNNAHRTAQERPVAAPSAAQRPPDRQAVPPNEPQKPLTEQLAQGQLHPGGLGPANTTQALPTFASRIVHAYATRERVGVEYIHWKMRMQPAFKEQIMTAAKKVQQQTVQGLSQLKAKYGEPLNKLHGELCVQLGAIRGQGNLEQERALNKLKGHAELATAVLQAVERNDANAMQRMAAKGLGSFEQCLVNLLNHWQQMKARVAAGDPAENSLKLSTPAAPVRVPMVTQQTPPGANVVPPATTPANPGPPPPWQIEPLPPLPPQVISHMQGLSFEQLQVHMARLKQRLADEEHPQGAAAAGSNVERLERIRGLRRQIAVGEQCARKFESRKAAVSTPGVTAAVVVAPNVNGAGRGVNAVGQAVNGSGQGVNGVGQGANGFGQGVNGVGQAVNGSGRGVIGAGRTAPGAEQGTNGVGTGVERGGQGVNGIGRGVIGAGEAASAANGSGLAQTAGCTWDEASSDSESEDLPILKDQRAPFHRGLTGAKKAVVKEGGEGTVIRLRLPKASVNAIPGGGVNGAKRTVAPDKTATGDESGVSAGGVKGSRVNGAGKKTSGVDRASGKKSINPSVNGASTDGARQGSPVVNGSAGLVIKLGSDGNTGSAKGAAVKGSSVNGDRGARVVTLGGVNRPGKGTSAPGAKKADMPPTSPESASKRTVAKMGGVGGTPNVPPTNEGTQGATQPGARPLPKKITIVRKGKANEEVEGVGRAVGGAEKPSRDAESGAAQQVAGEAKAPLKRDKKRKSLVAGSSANEGGGGEMGQPGNRGGKPGGPLLPRLDENGPPEKKLKVRFEKPIARPGNAGAFADAPPTLGETDKGPSAAPKPNPTEGQANSSRDNRPPTTPSSEAQAPPAGIPLVPLPAPPSELQPLPPLPPQLRSFIQGESAEDLQNHIARLQERLASENDPPSSAAPLSTDADSKKLERIRLLQRQLDLCQQRAKELENQPLGSSAQKRVVGASGAAGSVRTYANGVGNGVKGAAAKGVSAVSQPVVKGGLPGPRRAVERSRENGAQPEGKTGGLPRSSGTVAATRGGVNGASQPPARESPSRPQQTAAAKAQGGAAIGADKPLSLSNAEEIDDVTGALVAWMVNWKSRSSGSAPTSGRGTGTVAPSGEEGRLPGGSSVARAVENGPPGKKQKVEVGNSEVLQEVEILDPEPDGAENHRESPRATQHDDGSLSEVADLKACGICEEEWHNDRRMTAIVPGREAVDDCGHVYCKLCLDDFFIRMSEKVKAGTSHYECPKRCNLGPKMPRLVTLYT